jgi:Ca2+-binding RTX toxin-like protein
MRRILTARVAVLAGVATMASLGGATVAVATHDNPICQTATPGVSCSDGNGRQTPGGGGTKVSHAGWPAVTGVLRQAQDNANHTIVGGPQNDELLGLAGSDHIVGNAGNDIIWGDELPTGNTTHQHDTLSGGAGNDWIYPSHGLNTISAGPGDDHVIAFYGHGTIDCGPGDDTAQVRENGAYALHGCEHVTHFCTFGSNSDGTCRKPGARALVIRRR